MPSSKSQTRIKKGKDNTAEYLREDKIQALIKKTGKEPVQRDGNYKRVSRISTLAHFFLRIEYRPFAIVPLRLVDGLFVRFGEVSESEYNSKTVVRCGGRKSFRTRNC